MRLLFCTLIFFLIVSNLLYASEPSDFISLVTFQNKMREKNNYYSLKDMYIDYFNSDNKADIKELRTQIIHKQVFEENLLEMDFIKDLESLKVYENKRIKSKTNNYLILSTKEVLLADYNRIPYKKGKLSKIYFEQLNQYKCDITTINNRVYLVDFKEFISLPPELINIAKLSIPPLICLFSATVSSILGEISYSSYKVTNDSDLAMYYRNQTKIYDKTRNYSYILLPIGTIATYLINKDRFDEYFYRIKTYYFE